MPRKPWQTIWTVWLKTKKQKYGSCKQCSWVETPLVRCTIRGNIEHSERRQLKLTSPTFSIFIDNWLHKDSLEIGTAGPVSISHSSADHLLRLLQAQLNTSADPEPSNNVVQEIIKMEDDSTNLTSVSGLHPLPESITIPTLQLLRPIVLAQVWSSPKNCTTYQWHCQYVGLFSRS